METDHVQHPDLRYRRTKRLGRLGDARAHQQPTVRAAFDAKTRRLAPHHLGCRLALQRRCRHLVTALTGQPGGACQCVIKHVLLVAKAPVIVPGAPVLAAAAQARDGKHSPGVHPRAPRRPEHRGDRDVESAVAPQHRRPVPVGVHVCTPHDKQRHLDVAMANGDLFDHELVFGGEGWFPQYGGDAGIEVVAQHRRWGRECFEGQMQDVAVVACPQGTNSAKFRQRDHVRLRSVSWIVHGQPGGRVMQPLAHQPPVTGMLRTACPDQDRVFQTVVSRWDDLSNLAGFGTRFKRNRKHTS